MAIGMNALLRNARLDAITTFAGNAALLRIYDGVRPATGGSATTLLAELTLASPMAAGAAVGVLTLSAITSDASANATGTATWARIVKADGTTHVMDLSVGTSGADINFATVAFVAAAVISITSATITEANA